MEGEGHAHLYLDGQKIARVYGEWYHLPKLEGDHELRVTLNTNDHQDYAVKGEVVGATKKIGVSVGRRSEPMWWHFVREVSSASAQMPRDDEPSRPMQFCSAEHTSEQLARIIVHAKA